MILCLFILLAVFTDPVANNEPIKRQRRWNSDGLKVPEPHSTNSTPTTTPKDTFQTTPKGTFLSTGLKRSFSRSDSTNSDNTPKERVGELLMFSE